MPRVPKLSEYVELAASEYWQETGHSDLDARWSAEFFQDGGVLDDYPGLNLVDFHNLVQKVLTNEAERRAKTRRASKTG